MWRWLRSVAFLLPAETAHHLAIWGLRWGSRIRVFHAKPPLHDPIELWGQTYRNRLGVAAGFDKGDVVAPALWALGFGFVEIGTVTPRPQPGNPRPRLFRLPQAQALVNRLGFNNPGATVVAARLARLARHGPRPGPLWINLGKNKETPNETASDDYVSALTMLLPYGDVFVVNVSSPNTKGLRELLLPAALRPLLERVVAAAAGKPILLKLSPDLPDEAFADLVRLCKEVGLAGLIATNTTISRPVPSNESGGLSGAPLRPRALAVLQQLRELCGDDLVLVGVGGVMNAQDFNERRAREPPWCKRTRAGFTAAQVGCGRCFGAPSRATL